MDEVLALCADHDDLCEMVRDAYDYTPECTSVAEQIAARFPDIARERDKA